MSQPVYQKGSEPVWWWRVAKHLDDAQLASVNAMAHNLDDQTLVFALQDKMREAQAILLEIFRSKGLLPTAARAPAEEAAPVPEPEPIDSVDLLVRYDIVTEDGEVHRDVAGIVVTEAAAAAQEPEVQKVEEPVVIVIQDVAVEDPEGPKAEA